MNTGAHQVAGMAAKQMAGICINSPIVYGITQGDTPLFRGDVLFHLKATHGFPLDFALDRLINERGIAVEWPGFIEAARDGGWWDFQTFEVIEHAMQDAGIEREYRAAVLERFKAYVLQRPHPRMT